MPADRVSRMGYEIFDNLDMRCCFKTVEDGSRRGCAPSEPHGGERRPTYDLGSPKVPGAACLVAVRRTTAWPRLCVYRRA